MGSEGWFKPPSTIIVELFLSPFNFVGFCFMYFGAVLLGARIYVYNYYVLMN